jgi:hypothetical protein
MADQNPTADPRVAPVDLPHALTKILRDELLGWIDGIEDDLDWAPERLRDPDAIVHEADAFRRLLRALEAREIKLPDESARAALGRAAHGYDEAIEYERILAPHDAHHALLAILDRAQAAR